MQVLSDDIFNHLMRCSLGIESLQQFFAGINRHNCVLRAVNDRDRDLRIQFSQLSFVLVNKTSQSNAKNSNVEHVVNDSFMNAENKKKIKANYRTCIICLEPVPATMSDHAIFSLKGNVLRSHHRMTILKNHHLSSKFLDPSQDHENLKFYQ